MYPELFEIPIIHMTVKSYGLMMVVGFLAAVWLIRRLSQSFTPNPQLIINAALYSLIGGVVGARLFYVVHYFDKFRANLLDIFAIWQGGLELLGGVIVAVAVILIYLLYHKLPVRRYFDVLAIGLMLALAFGRIGCFLNGCCYGKPTDLPWAVRFPPSNLVHRYSFAFESQVNPDPDRNRPEPQLKLSDDYFSYIDENGIGYLKSFEDLSARQQIEVTKGRYRCLPVHPTQLYSSANAAALCLILYLFWRRSQKADRSNGSRRYLTNPGSTFSLMFILYGVMRFFIEFLRDDNPYEFDGLTISQNICISMIVLGVILMIIFQVVKSESP